MEDARAGLLARVAQVFGAFFLDPKQTKNKNSSENSASTMRSVSRGLARASQASKGHRTSVVVILQLAIGYPE